MNRVELWKRYQEHLCSCPSIGLQLDVSRMNFDDGFLDRLSDPIAAALDAMQQLEGGAKANVDEDRRVGHYWLRAPALAPDESIRKSIEQTVSDIKRFADQVHGGAVTPQRGDGFFVVLLVGIGGSALGPQFVSDALGTTDDPMIVRFMDNTDPDGIDRTLAELDELLEQTLTIVVSKSGGTKETRNGMLEVAAAYERAGLDFAKHAVAVTCEGSELYEKAIKEKWLLLFPLWDWVGGRTSETSAVGLLPAALQGIDVDALLAGAAACDEITRSREVLKNPAALLALMWYYAGESRGSRNMVILPYRDRLALLGKYLQQLVMESLGKERDRAGEIVHQGLTVFGHKGSTDQHAYVQQLRDGPDDFFVTFLRVLRQREGGHKAAPSIEVEEGVTTGDYLDAFWQGTREALYDNGRESITISLDELRPREVGVLIALFERAVGLYAELINVNAYDQPGVEAGKKAAGVVLELQKKVLAHLRRPGGSVQTPDEIAAAIGEPDEIETIYHILQHAATDPEKGLRCEGETTPTEARYGRA